MTIFVVSGCIERYVQWCFLIIISPDGSGCLKNKLIAEIVHWSGLKELWYQQNTEQGFQIAYNIVIFIQT